MLIWLNNSIKKHIKNIGGKEMAKNVFKLICLFIILSLLLVACVPQRRPVQDETNYYNDNMMDNMTRTHEFRNGMVEMMKTPEMRQAMVEMMKTPEMRQAMVEMMKTPEMRQAMVEVMKTPEMQSVLEEIFKE